MSSEQSKCVCLKCGSPDKGTGGLGWKVFLCQTIQRIDKPEQIVESEQCLRNQLSASEAARVKVEQENDNLKRRVGELEEALKPFARFCLWLEAAAEQGEIELTDHTSVAQLSFGGGSDYIWMADLRKAKALLAQPADATPDPDVPNIDAEIRSAEFSADRTIKNMFPGIDAEMSRVVGTSADEHERNGEG